jgi:hypothetical protein
MQVTSTSSGRGKWELIIDVEKYVNIGHAAHAA